mgnify:CR=1 FL=1
MENESKKRRRNKKAIFQLSYLSLELEETEEFLEEYIKKFNEDFKDELNFIAKKQSIEESEKESDKDTAPGESDPNTHPTLHKIYRNIVKCTHPDVHGEKYIDLFQKAGRALEEECWVDMITIAGELRIELPEFDSEVIHLIESNAESVKNKINNKKESLAWTWNKKKGQREALKKNIYKHFNIDKKEFEEYLKNKD